MVPPDWVQLPVSAPPTIAAAMGYPAGARWFSIVWTPYGDEADYDDGYMSGTGDWQGFLAFTRHRRVAPHLAGYDLGLSEVEGTHALVIDQENRAVYVAPAHSARQFLIRQQPSRGIPDDLAEAAAVKLEDFLDVTRWQEVELDPAAVEGSMRRRAEAITAMMEFLDSN